MVSWKDVDEWNSHSREKPESCSEVSHEQRWPWSVQPRTSFPSPVLTPLCVCMRWRLYVSECVCTSCSNWRVREDSLIQLSSVDSITNPLHLLKHPPPKNTSLPLFHVPVPGVPGARLRLCLRLHTSYRPWPGSFPPTPFCTAYINRRKNK